MRRKTSDDAAEESHKAAIEGNLWTLTRLLEGGLDVNAGVARAPGVTALHLAICANRLESVEYLIKHRANLEAHPRNDEVTDTPLAYAVAGALDSVAQSDGSPGEEPTQMVELLLDAGADPQPGLVELASWQGDEPIPLAKILLAARRRRQG